MLTNTNYDIIKEKKGQKNIIEDAKLYDLAVKIAQDHIFKTGSLDLLEAKIRENPNVLLIPIEIEGMQGTLEQLAIINLDCTIIIESRIEEGAIDRLRLLRLELLPDTMFQALEQTKYLVYKEDIRREEFIERIRNYQSSPLERFNPRPFDIGTELGRVGLPRFMETDAENEKIHLLRKKISALNIIKTSYIKIRGSLIEHFMNLIRKRVSNEKNCLPKKLLATT